MIVTYSSKFRKCCTIVTTSNPSPHEPSNVLHLSNIPDGKTEEDIVNIFSKHAAVQKFKFFKDTKMALIQVGSIDDAIHCLIKTHNHRMSANQHLRVSFSKGFLS